jgi:hypothetical protein
MPRCLCRLLINRLTLIPSSLGKLPWMFSIHSVLIAGFHNGLGVFELIYGTHHMISIWNYFHFPFYISALCLFLLTQLLIEIAVHSTCHIILLRTCFPGNSIWIPFGLWCTFGFYFIYICPPHRVGVKSRYQQVINFDTVSTADTHKLMQSKYDAITVKGGVLTNRCTPFYFRGKE